MNPAAGASPRSRRVFIAVAGFGPPTWPGALLGDLRAERRRCARPWHCPRYVAPRQCAPLPSRGCSLRVRTHVQSRPTPPAANTPESGATRSTSHAAPGVTISGHIAERGVDCGHFGALGWFDGEQKRQARRDVQQDEEQGARHQENHRDKRRAGRSAGQKEQQPRHQKARSDSRAHRIPLHVTEHQRGQEKGAPFDIESAIPPSWLPSPFCTA